MHDDRMDLTDYIARLLNESLFRGLCRAKHLGWFYTTETCLSNRIFKAIQKKEIAPSSLLPIANV